MTAEMISLILLTPSIPFFSPLPSSLFSPFPSLLSQKEADMLWTVLWRSPLDKQLISQARSKQRLEDSQYLCESLKKQVLTQWNTKVTAPKLTMQLQPVWDPEWETPSQVSLKFLVQRNCVSKCHFKPLCC